MFYGHIICDKFLSFSSSLYPNASKIFDPLKIHYTNPGIEIKTSIHMNIERKKQ